MRGAVVIRDRKSLEAKACQCYVLYALGAASHFIILRRTVADLDALKQPYR